MKKPERDSFGSVVIRNGIINCRVTITGTYKGKTFTYIDAEGEPGSQFIHAGNDPSTFWWSEGNFACDCNRGQFVGLDLPCGDAVLIDSIVPLDPSLPSLFLNESTPK